MQYRLFQNTFIKQVLVLLSVALFLFTFKTLNALWATQRRLSNSVLQSVFYAAQYSECTCTLLLRRLGVDHNISACTADEWRVWVRKYKWIWIIPNDHEYTWTLILYTCIPVSCLCQTKKITTSFIFMLLDLHLY